MDSLKTEKPIAFLSRDQLIRRFTVMALENCELLTLSIKDILKKVKYSGDKEELLKLILENYDGYLFDPDAKEQMVNPTLFLYLLDIVHVCISCV